jgi:hypothetical protein
VVLLGVLIAIGGITESELRHHDKGYMTRVAATGIAGGVIIGIFLYLLWLSILVLRMRFDHRGIIYTRGKTLMTKIPWKDVREVHCYEREGGIAKNKTVRGFELRGKNPPTSVIPLFSRNRDIIRMESDVWGQESLDKTVSVIRHYREKYHFDAEIDEWAQTDQFMFVSGKSSKKPK